MNEKLGFVWEIIKTVIGVLLFVAFFRFFILQPFYVIGSSMEPTFQNGDYLFVDQISYRFSKPKRGDVIVFRHPDESCTPFVKRNPIIKNVIEGPCQSFIKRIIALPGEEIEVKNGRVRVNGATLEEDYILEGVRTMGDQSVKLGKNEFFVMGDNRLPNMSSDSREWGPLSSKFIIGKSFVRLLPVNNSTFFTRPDYSL